MVYDTTRHMIQCEAKTTAEPTVVKYCEEDKRLFTGLVNGRVIIWDTTGLPIQKMTELPDSAGSTSLPAITALGYDQISATAIVGNKEGISFWVIKGSSDGCWGRIVGQVQGITSPPTAVAWVSSSHEILATFPNGTVCVFDLDTGNASHVMIAHSAAVSEIIWIDAERRLLTASKDKTVRIWDFPGGRGMRSSAGRDSVVTSTTNILPEKKSNRKSLSKSQSGGSSLPWKRSSTAQASTATSQSSAVVGGDELLFLEPKKPPIVEELPPAPIRAVNQNAKRSPALATDSDDDLIGWDR